MSIIRSLRDYLLGGETLAGHAARPFVRPQTVGKHVCKNRNDAREALRGILGQAFYRDRLPQDAGPIAVVARLADVERDYGLKCEDTSRIDYVSLTIHSRGQSYADRAGVVADLISLSVSGFREGKWGDLQVCECIVESDASNSLPKLDGTDEHSFQRFVDLTIINEPPAPIYAAVDITAQFAFVTAAGVGPDIRLLDGSLVSEGATLSNIAWEIREVADGAVVASFAGAPNAAASLSGVTGTNREPSIDRSTFSLNGTIYVTLTVTDNDGQIDSVTMSQTI